MNAMIQKNLRVAQWAVLTGIVVLQLGAIARDFKISSTSTTTAPSVPTQANLSTLSSTTKWVAFGQSAATHAVSQSFLLMGIFESKPTNLSSAVISNKKNGEQGLYQVGDKLPDGSRVNKIENQRVVLRRQDGELVSIMMEENTSELSSNNIPPSAAPTTNFQQQLQERMQQYKNQIPPGNNYLNNQNRNLAKPPQPRTPITMPTQEQINEMMGRGL